VINFNGDTRINTRPLKPESIKMRSMGRMFQPFFSIQDKKVKRETSPLKILILFSLNRSIRYPHTQCILGRRGKDLGERFFLKRSIT
jgi:hypothetical protein